MGLISLLLTNPVLFLLLTVPLLYSVILHEIAHGLAASWFGDDTARHARRLTLNPLEHIDPVGAFMLLFFGFGWAKPVPVNYYNLRKGNPRMGVICVALAGCVTNILIATLAIALMRVPGLMMNPVFAVILPIVAKINIILAAFNLIPIPPLDGSRVLSAFLPWESQARLAALEPYGFLIIILLLYTGILYPFIEMIQHAIYMVIALIL